MQKYLQNCNILSLYVTIEKGSLGNETREGAVNMSMHQDKLIKVATAKPHIPIYIYTPVCIFALIIFFIAGHFTSTKDLIKVHCTKWRLRECMH